MKRPAEEVLKGVRNGFVFVEKAKEHGIVVDPTFFNADEEGTEKEAKLN